MVLYSLEARDALIIPSGTPSRPDTPHLFTVITNPWEYQGSRKVIMVNISSIKPNVPFDQTCVIRSDEGANDFITRHSYVIYRFAQVREESKLTELREKGIIIPNGLMSNDCYRRMCAGIQRSAETAEGVKAAYRHYLESE